MTVLDPKSNGELAIGRWFRQQCAKWFGNYFDFVPWPLNLAIINSSVFCIWQTAKGMVLKTNFGTFPVWPVLYLGHCHRLLKAGCFPGIPAAVLLDRHSLPAPICEMIFLWNRLWFHWSWVFTFDTCVGKSQLKAQVLTWTPPGSPGDHKQVPFSSVQWEELD